MKVMIFANNDIGLYKFRKELIEELVKSNDVYICLPKGDYIQDLKSLGAKFIPCDLLDRHGTNPLKELKLISWYKSILKKYKPDIAFTYTIKPNVYAGMACASFNIPYVANITGLGTAVENPGLMQFLTVNLYRYGLRKAQKVFFQNTENRDFMVKKGVVKKNYDMLPESGVNLNNYTVSEYPNGDTVDFVFVSRIMKEKGIDQYLEAAKEIRKRHPETRFHICGFCEQDYQAELEKLVQQGIVIYHGLVSDMTPIYRIASCIIHPTYYPEGLSNVLLESCASGRPIITTNRSGCREVVDNGINGYIVNQKDSEDLIDKIGTFLTLSMQERKNMGLAGRRKVEQEFDRKIVIEKYMKELDVTKKQNALIDK